VRTLLLVVSLCLACTRLNPAFDASRDANGETGVGDGGTESDTQTTDTGINEDLPPEPTCEFQPSSGLKIEVGDPMRFGGVCPVGINIWTQVSSTEGGEALLATCTEGCVQCTSDEHPVAAFPLNLTDHLPLEPGVCLRLEAQTLLAETPERCVWGALTIYDALFEAPYVIAIARSSEPTASAAGMLGGLIPDPLLAGTCSCEEVGHADDDCCLQADGPPEFWYYPFANVDVFPGDSVPLSLPSQLGLQYAFELFQAERIPGCNTTGFQTSWAVVAEL
jgi:hypothetical protein